MVGFKNPSGLITQANVDANGNLITVAYGPGGAPTSVWGGAAPPTLSAQGGPLIMARQDMPTPASFEPVLVDQLGSVQAHLKSKVTFRSILAQVAAATNKVLFSVYNGSTTGMVLRVQEVSLYITPQSVGGTLLGSSSIIYYPVYCQMHRITGHAAQTGSTTMAYVASDTSDTIDPNVTLFSNAAVTGLATQPFHRGDANNSGAGRSWYGRGDVNEKTLVIRPGQGAAIVCVSNGIIANGTGTQVAAVDVEVVITQAPA